MEIYKNLSLEYLPNEEWRFIPNCDNLYMVSNLGRIKALKTFRSYGKFKRTCKERIMKQSSNWQGYLHCIIRDSKGAKIRISSHKCVCDIFIPNPNKYPCTNHKNEIKWDNRAENLEHCTYAYNLAYGSRKGEKDIPVCQYDLQGNFIKEFKSVRDASIATNTNRRSISNVTHGWAKSAGGYIWKKKDDSNDIKIEPYIDNNKHRVVCYDMQGNMIDEYNSIAEASASLGLWQQDISACCRGVKQRVKQYIFKYK